MPKSAKLEFFELMMRQLRVKTQRVRREEAASCRPDLGLRAFLGREESVEASFGRLFSAANGQTIYKLTDEFDCCYIFLLLPGEEELLLAGPFLSRELSREDLEERAQELGITTEQYPRFEAFFADLAVVSDPGCIAALLSALGVTLWGAKERFDIVDIDLEMRAMRAQHDSAHAESEGFARRMKMMEDRYACENELMELVSRGRATKALMVLGNFSQFVMEQRSADSLRNSRNYAIILNTLLRKAVERGGVHPIHIDRLSSEIARRIERVSSWDELMELIRQMVTEYCTLVRKHATARYSPLVQRVIVRVDFDLAADLSLKANAEYLNVSAGYLSGLFKREVGETLTEFVNGRRVEHASYLLRSTRMSVSAIAQSCGIADDNYFARLFKKHTGKTPKQYRDEARARP